ncbi:MAG: hypothetical protein ACI39W_04270 [Brotaphodocola sp.]
METRLFGVLLNEMRNLRSGGFFGMFDKEKAMDGIQVCRSMTLETNILYMQDMD